MTVGHKALANLLFVELGHLAQLLHRRMTLVLLLKLVNLVVDLVERPHLIERQAHDAALLCNGLQDALANPPYCIGYKLESTCLVEFLGSLDKPDVTLVNQISKSESLVLILLCYRHDESQVGCHQLVLGSLALRTSLAYLLCQLNLLVDGDKRCTTDFHKILVQSFARTVCNTLLNL